MKQLESNEEIREAITSALTANDRWVLVAGDDDGVHMIRSIVEGVLFSHSILSMLSEKSAQDVSDRIQYAGFTMHVLESANRGAILVVLIPRDLLPQHVLELGLSLRGVQEGVGEGQALILVDSKDVRTQERCVTFIQGLLDGTTHDQSSPQIN